MLVCHAYTHTVSYDQMFLLFYSDEAYTLPGFIANYTTLVCATSCIHGNCSGAACVCSLGWTGVWCSVPACPSNCSYALGRGTCSLAASQCICAGSYTGADCSVPVASNTFRELVSTQTAAPLFGRFAHSAVYDDVNDAIWVYGGYNLNAALSDVIQYSFASGEWITISTLVTPVRGCMC